MTYIKICGLTNLEDALVAVEAGADLLGFIFYEPSPRYVRPEAVKEIVSSVKCQVTGDGRRGMGDGGQKMRDSGLRSPVSGHSPPVFVGVFVNASLEGVTRILDFCQLDAAQLHGEESLEFVNHFQSRAFKALRPQSQEEAEALIQQYQYSNLPIFQSSNLPTLLLDAYHPTLHGGTGHVTDWTLAASIARRYPIMLAGSLTPANVAEAIQAVKPWGVDVSSGVEKEKGRKDHEKVRAFVKAVKRCKA